MTLSSPLKPPADDSRHARLASKDLAASDATLACAQTLMDLVPGLMDQMRQHMRANAPVGVSVPQMRMLIYARRHGGTSLTDIAEHLGVTLPTVSVAAQRLVQSGWLDSRTDPSDRRRNAFWLTPTGEAVVANARHHTRHAMATGLLAADADALATIQAGLDALKQVVQRTSSAGSPPVIFTSHTATHP